MEGAAKDFIRQFGITAGDDLENVTQLVGEGAYKLRGMCLLSFALQSDNANTHSRGNPNVPKQLDLYLIVLRAAGDNVGFGIVEGKAYSPQ